MAAANAEQKLRAASRQLSERQKERLRDIMGEIQQFLSNEGARLRDDVQMLALKYFSGGNYGQTPAKILTMLDHSQILLEQVLSMFVELPKKNGDLKEEISEILGDATPISVAHTKIEQIAKRLMAYSSVRAALSDDPEAKDALRYLWGGYGSLHQTDADIQGWLQNCEDRIKLKRRSLS
jgi:hypothetical protein